MAKSPKDTEKYIINNQYFLGGASLDYKMGIANAYYGSHNLDGRTFPSQISVLPGNQAIATNLADLIQAIEMDLSGVRYAVGNQGFIYKIDTNDVVSSVGQMSENGSAGLLYSQITDSLYIPGQTTVSMYSQVSSGIPGSPVLRLNQFAKSASIANGCTVLYDYTDGLFDSAITRNNAQSVGLTSGITNPSQVNNSFTNSYTLPTTIIEDAGPTSALNQCFFAPDIEPFYSIAVYVANKGSGNWTLTLHNSLNEQLASVTITNANMQTGWNEFVFGSQIRAYVNASNTGFSPTYHFHLTSSVSSDNAAVSTYANGDLSGVNFLLFAYRLVETHNGWHPTAYFTGTGQPLLCIGNGNYLSTYNFSNDANPSNAQWQRHALTFEPGDEVTFLTVNNQYLVIGTERRSKDAARNYQRGKLYFWDGSTNSPNFTIPIPMGSPYGGYTLNNVTYFICAGALYAWSGGSTVIKIRRLLYQNTDYQNAVDQTLVNPNSLTSRYNILYIGYPSSTNFTNIDFGTWSYGAYELTFPNCLVYSYSQSHGILDYTSSNNLQQGCVVNFVDSMYSSWQYTDANSVTHYGLDVVNNSSPPASFFDWTYLIYDGGAVYKEKMAVRYKIYFEPLPTGCSLTPFWIIDRGTKQTGPTVGAGATEVFVEMNNARFHELQWGFSGTCVNATTPPVILGISMEIDPNEREVDLVPGEE